jgi:hypothetical protein
MRIDIYCSKLQEYPISRQSNSTLESSGDIVMPTSTNSIEPNKSSQKVTQTRHQEIEQAVYWSASECGIASGVEIED